MNEKTNPVVVAGEWMAKQEPTPQGHPANYSALARVLGVKRQVVQRYKASGRFPADHIKTLVEYSEGELTEDVLTP